MLSNCYFCYILRKTEFSQQSKEKYAKIKFQKIGTMGAEFL